tara:strand:+ start:127 stop:276 length:150 start_codon:yes stop_codon:yes gene_type:complete
MLRLILTAGARARALGGLFTEQEGRLELNKLKNKARGLAIKLKKERDGR